MLIPIWLPQSHLQFWQPGGLWVSGFWAALGKALPVMAAASQPVLEAAAAAAAGAQGPLAAAAAAGAAAATQQVAAQQHKQHLVASGGINAMGSGSSGSPLAPLPAADPAGPAAGMAAGGAMQLLRSVSASSLCCLEQLSQDATAGAAADQHTASTADQPAATQALALTLQPQPQRVVPAGKRKRPDSADG